VSRRVVRREGAGENPGNPQGHTPATKRKTPQQKRSALTKKADILFSKVIRLRDKWCQECGTPNDLQCAHIWPRRTYFSVRFEEMNAVALCAAHHLFFTHRPAHWYKWVEGYLGKRDNVLLREQALFGASPSYDEIIPRLQARLRELEEA